jgi:hypothetical protein
MGTTLVCRSLASCCGSRVGRVVTLRATGRPASADCSARKTRANAPDPSSPTSLNPQNVSPTAGNRADDRRASGEGRVGRDALKSGSLCDRTSVARGTGTAWVRSYWPTGGGVWSIPASR